MDVAFVAAQCEQIGQHVTALAAVAGGDEDGLVGGAKAVAGATHALVHWVNGFVLEQEEREEREEVVVLLRDYVERLKDAIVAFVKQKREAFANPMDFLLQQQLDRDRKRVAEAVRHVQQVVASIAGADGSAADSVMSVKEAADITAAAEHTVTCLEALRAIVVGPRHEGAFRPAVKALVDSIRSVASFFERHREFAADFNAMKDAMLRTITDAQVAFTPDAESGHRDTFERSYQATLDTVRHLLTAVSARSANFSRTLSQGKLQPASLMSPRSRISVANLSVLANAQSVHALKLSAMDAVHEGDESCQGESKRAPSPRRETRPSPDSEASRTDEERSEEGSETPGKTRRSGKERSVHRTSSKRGKASEGVADAIRDEEGAKRHMLAVLKQVEQAGQAREHLRELGTREREQWAVRVLDTLHEHIPELRAVWAIKSEDEKKALRKAVTSDLAAFEQAVRIQDATPLSPKRIERSRKATPRTHRAREAKESKEKEKERDKDKDKDKEDEDELAQLMTITSTADLHAMTRSRPKDGGMGRYKTLRNLEDLFKSKRKPVQELQVLAQSGMEARTIALKDTVVNVLLKLNFMFGCFESALQRRADGGMYEQIKGQLLGNMERLYVMLLETLVDVHGQCSSAEQSGAALRQALAKAGEAVTSARRQGEVASIDQELLAVGHHVRLIEAKLLMAFHHAMAQFHFLASQVLTGYSACRASDALRGAVPALLHYVATLLSLVRCLDSLVRDMETMRYLDILYDDHQKKQHKASKKKAKPAAPDVWPQPPPAPSTPDAPGDLNELIVRLTPGSGAEMDHEFVNAVLTTWPAFCTAHELLERLVVRFETPKTLTTTEAGVIKTRVVGFVKKWVAAYPEYLDASMHALLHALIAALRKEKLFEPHAETLAQAMQRASQFVVNEELVKELQHDVPVYAGDAPHEALLGVDDAVLAEQLTLIEFSIYRRIEAPELLGQAWNSEKRQCLARNVVELLQRANRVSFWVATTILLQPRLKDRVRCVTKILGVARQLRVLNNYNTLMGVVAGLNVSAVSRLRHTFAGVKGKAREAWDELQALVDPSNSFRNFRHAVEEAGRTAIPYLGMYLSDLTFMEDGSLDHVERNGKQLINFPKHFMIYQTINQLLKYQLSADYSALQRVDPAYTFVYELCALDENLLYTLSLEREPRGAALKDLE